VSDYAQGLIAGLSAAARICEETATLLDRATRECDREGSPDISDLTAAGAVYLRHAAARIRSSGTQPD